MKDHAPLPSLRSHVTLVLCTVLHGFTHAYGSMLVPLYFRMTEDLKLPGIRAASLVVTVYGGVYNLASYAAGVLSDRFSRKTLLAIGLFGNAAAIVGIGVCRSYPVILLLGVVAGLFGSIFHPAANALAPSHYPRSPGMAIGLLGIGSGLGFFFGPQFAGWRAGGAAWHWGNIAQWQKPCVELGIAGMIVGVVFLVFGTDPHPAHVRSIPRPMGQKLLRNVSLIAATLMFRDFAGVAALSLAAIYFHRVYGLGVEQTGLLVGLMMLPSVVVNPLLVYLTPRGKRLPGLAMILICGGILAVSTPLLPSLGAKVTLCLFQAMQMGSYAVSDASILERVAPAVRGRVVGLFLMIAGAFGALGPWVMGGWTDWLGPRANNSRGYYGLFALIGAFMVIAAVSVRYIERLGAADESAPIRPVEEISPATLG